MRIKIQQFYFGIEIWKTEDTALQLYSARSQLKRIRFSTKNLVHHETGRYLTVVQMGWLIAQRRQDSYISHAVTDKGDHPDTEPCVCDGLIQIHTAIKQHYIGGS